jgi:hypothetical protein
MTKELVEALNLIDAFFHSISEDSPDEIIGEGILVSNHLDLIQDKFVESVVKTRLQRKTNLIINTGAKA